MVEYQNTTNEQLKQTAFAQPAVFIIEYALAQVLMEWGIRPEAMLGYSLGEYVAACLAGVLSLRRCPGAGHTACPTYSGTSTGSDGRRGIVGGRSAAISQRACLPGCHQWSK